ncbi:hypothetical protein EB74_20920 [Mycobacterium sp. SWH-M5]|nr:hypothetical protein EB74_20920 [Mycobacterium sp. SWH-M5]PJK23762.1 hypothetical protein CSX11_04090 [Mycolicibacterium goodii]
MSFRDRQCVSNRVLIVFDGGLDGGIDVIEVAVEGSFVLGFVTLELDKLPRIGVYKPQLAEVSGVADVVF